jgi:hypothetical protein
VFKTIILPVKEFDSCWVVCPFTGSLLKENKEFSFKNIQHPQKLTNALKFCNEPFKLQANISTSQIKIDENIFDKKCKLISMEKYLNFLGNHNFYLSLVYAGFSNNLFSNTKEAMIEISKLSSQKEGNRCLQRTLLAAKTSKSFKNNGVILIGAQIPTARMHAWIIEENYQPDLEDRGWINYRPLLAII